MKRLLALALVMGLFYVTMASMSSAQQKENELKTIAAPFVQPSDNKDQDYSKLNRDDLKTNLARAYYDALSSAEDDIEDEEIEGQDGNKRSAFQEARRTIFQADKILARVKADNKKAIAILKNPPRRVYRRRAKAPKVIEKKDQQAIKGEIQKQEQLIQKQQQKLNNLKKELVLAPAER